MKRQTPRPGRIKTAIRGWLGMPDDLAVAGLSGMTATSDSGMLVTSESMLTLSAVWACARLISETIGTLPLSLYERSSTGKSIARHHPLQMIIHDQPNAATTASIHWEATVAAMLLRGVAYAEILKVGERIVGLRFLSPERLGITFGGRRRYLYNERGTQREIPENRIFKIPGFSTDGENGLSVIRYSANVMGAALSADQAANKTFTNGLMNAVYFKMEKTLNKGQREEFRANLREITGSLNAGKSPLLEAGMTADSIGINPKDAQLLESRAFSVEEICRWFRVPPFMIGHAEKSTSWGSGIEQQMIGFLTFTLAPWLRRIEQAISKDLLTPAERLRYYPKFSVEGLLRADSAGRASFYGSMVNNGIFTRDEVRELEDRPPMGGNASVLTVQTAMAPLDSLGQSTDAAQARAARKRWLNDQHD